MAAISLDETVAPTTDLASNISGLARDVLPMLRSALPAGPPEAQAEALARLLEHMLRSLPALDARHHRRRLIRWLASRLRSIIAPALEFSATDSWDENSLVDHCLAQPEFHTLADELQAGLCIAQHSNLTATIDCDPASSDDDEDNDSEHGNAADELDTFLQDELNADLPPFLELPSAVATIVRNEAGVAEAWHKLRAFSASDLLESDQWPDLPHALRVLLLCSHLDARERSQVAALHIAIFEEGAPAQRASMALNACALLRQRRQALHQRQPGGGGASTRGGGQLGGELGDRSSLLCAQLVCTARFDLCNDGVLLSVGALHELLEELMALAQTASEQQDTPPRQLRREPSAVLAAMDPSASWAARLLARARLHRAAWRAVCESGLLAQSEASLRAPLPPSLPSSPASAMHDGEADDDESDDEPTPATWELRLAASLHHTCIAALGLRHAAAAPDAASARFKEVVYDAAWAAAALPSVLARLAQLAHQKVAGSTPFVSVARTLALEALSASVASLAHPQCIDGGVWTAGAARLLLAPLSTMCGQEATDGDSVVEGSADAEEQADESAERAVHAALAAESDTATSPATGSNTPSGLLAAASFLLPAATALGSGGPSAKRVLTQCRAHPRLLCRVALGLLSAPPLPTDGSDSSAAATSSASSSAPLPSPAPSCRRAQALGVRCVAILTHLLDDEECEMALRLRPCLASAVGRAQSNANGPLHSLRLSAIGWVARAWCSSAYCASRLPREALTPLAASLLLLPSMHAISPPAGDAVGGSSDGAATGDAGLQQVDEEEADAAGMGGDEATRLAASALGATSQGLDALVASGLAIARARSFVRAAQAGADSVAALHGPLMPGAHAPVLHASADLIALLGWPHALSSLSGDGAPTAAVLDAPFVQLMLLTPPRLLDTSASAGSHARWPRNYEESHASALLMSTVLCVAPRAALSLRRRYSLANGVRWLQRRAGAEEADGSDEADEAAGGVAAMRIAEHDEWRFELGEVEQLGRPRSAEVVTPTAASAAAVAADGDAEAWRIVDLNSVCRARLLMTVEQWGTPAEWPPSHPLHALATHSAHPLELRRASAAAASATAGAAAASAGAASDGAVASNTPSAADEAIAAIRASPSARVQLAAPLLCCVAARELVASIWAQCREHASSRGHAEPSSSLVAADALDHRPPMEEDAGKGKVAPVRQQHTGGETARTAGTAPPAEVSAGSMLFLRYSQRMGALGTAGDLPSKCDALSALLLRMAGPSVSFDAMTALVFVLMDDADAAAELLDRLRGHAAASYLLPRLTEGQPSHGSTLIRLVERLVALELPQLHQAAQRAALPVALAAARWLDASWLNFVRWRSLTAALVLPLLLGADVQVYLCVAALRHAEAAALGAHPAEVHLHLLMPLDGFDVIGAVPLILDLRERHGAACQAALAVGGKASV